MCDKRKQQVGLRNEADNADPLKSESEPNGLACPLEDRPRPILTGGKHTSEAMKSPKLDMRLSCNDLPLTSQQQRAADHRAGYNSGLRRRQTASHDLLTRKRLA